MHILLLFLFLPVQSATYSILTENYTTDTGEKNVFFVLVYICTNKNTITAPVLLSCELCVFQGLLQQNGSCVPPEECGCVHLQHQASGEPPKPVTVPQGATVTIGCSTWLLKTYIEYI